MTAHTHTHTHTQRVLQHQTHMDGYLEWAHRKNALDGDSRVAYLASKHTPKKDPQKDTETDDA